MKLQSNTHQPGPAPGTTLVPVRNRTGLWVILPEKVAESLRYWECYEQRNGTIIVQNVKKKKYPLTHFAPVRRFLCIEKVS
jgi:hypothetical protein